MARRERRSFGAIRRLPSGRHQASYVGPDLKRHTAPTTFTLKGDAGLWLDRVRHRIELGTWTPAEAPDLSRLTLAEYAPAWLENREVGGKPLKPRTRAHYASLLDKFILPTFGDRPLRSVTHTEVRAWHTALRKQTGPTYRAHAYALLAAVYRSAVAEDLVDASPCRIDGAGAVQRATKTKPLTLDELAQLVEAMPNKYRSIVLIAAWCGLRFGELTELRRSDVDLERALLHVRRAVVRSGGEVIIGTPKSAAGIRDVAIPPHLLPAIQNHLDHYASPGRDGLLFPARGGGNLAPTTLAKPFYAARSAIGRPDLRFHDLRHTAAVLAASTGATLAELMARLGHSTSGAAMRYQHAALGRDAEIAAALSGLTLRS